jgi:hypothetical protein
MHHHVNQDEFLTSMISIISKIVVQIKKKWKLAHIIGCNTHESFCIP